MKHLELHILQSFPVACLNRDDLNSPKTAIFGGVQRARVSSQSWKRAIREMAKEFLPNMAGQRTKRIVRELSERLKKRGLDDLVATKYAELAASYLSKLDSKTDEGGYIKVKTLCFLSVAEMDKITDTVFENKDLLLKAEELTKLLHTDVKKAEKTLKECEKLISQKDVSKAIKSVLLKDAGDIALFGRMVADDHSLMVEAASMFSHALSTHKVDNEIDFFAAVDDLQSKEEAGAGMTGTLEFNSATYYRYVALNIDMLADEDHLASITQVERKEMVAAFIRATLMAVPVARKNSMNANTLPGYVLGIVREKGHPVQLVNAFEKPLRPVGVKGLFELSVEALKAEYRQIKDIWDLDEKEKVEMPNLQISDFIEKMASHVI